MKQTWSQVDLLGWAWSDNYAKNPKYVNNVTKPVNLQ